MTTTTQEQLAEVHAIYETLVAENNAKVQPLKRHIDDLLDQLRRIRIATGSPKVPDDNPVQQEWLKAEARWWAQVECDYIPRTTATELRTLAPLCACKCCLAQSSWQRTLYEWTGISLNLIPDCQGCLKLHDARTLDWLLVEAARRYLRAKAAAATQ